MEKRLLALPPSILEGRCLQQRLAVRRIPSSVICRLSPLSTSSNTANDLARLCPFGTFLLSSIYSLDHAGLGMLNKQVDPTREKVSCPSSGMRRDARVGKVLRNGNH